MPEFAEVATTGSYADLIGIPDTLTVKQTCETVTSGLHTDNLFKFNGVNINASNFSNAIFVIICHMHDGNGGLVTNGWAVIPSLQLKQQLFSSDNNATIYPSLAYGSTGSHNLGVKITGAQNNDGYTVDVFILKTK